MGFKHILGAAVLAGSLPMTAMAENFSYSYVEAGYHNLSGGFKDDGFFARASLALNDGFYVHGGVDYLADDDSQRTAELGLGVNGVFDNTVGVYFEAGAIRVDQWANKSKANSDTDTGLKLEAGMRVHLNSTIDAEVAYARVRVKSSDIYDGNHLRGGLRYSLTDALSLGVSYTAMSDANATEVGVRFSF
jgi:hypothetical protein